MSGRRIAIVLPGLHRVQRGAETAFESIGRELARIPGYEVTLFGSGMERAGEPYRFVHVPCSPREGFEKWPRLPVVRSETAWEELSFVRNLRAVYRAGDFDATVACSYPFCNWALRAWKDNGGRRPAHVFVTQNGDWPCRRQNAEYRFFGCDALVCTNPEYYERNRERYLTRLIPNGVDPTIFNPGEAQRTRFGLPLDRPIVLMVSALIPSKRVLEGIRVVSRLDGCVLVIAGDGPLRDDADRLGRELLGDRYVRLVLDRSQMPGLYRTADAVLHMSMVESSANLFTEALATELPVVTHDREVSRWTLEDVGYLTDTTDEAKTAQALRMALAEPRGARSEARRGLVERRYKWEGIANQYAAVVQDAVDALGDEGRMRAGAA